MCFKIKSYFYKKKMRVFLSKWIFFRLKKMLRLKKMWRVILFFNHFCGNFERKFKYSVIKNGLKKGETGKPINSKHKKRYLACGPLPAKHNHTCLYSTNPTAPKSATPPRSGGHSFKRNLWSTVGDRHCVTLRTSFLWSFPNYYH